jgi:D-hexose-6-phosphate mutarotase
MSLLQELKTRFTLAGQLTFREEASGLIFADIATSQATATVCLQGAHLTTWTPNGQTTPVIWLSNAAQYAPGKSIRGGVPVCWPWFGPHAQEASFPGHGFARTVPWQVTATHALSDAVQITLQLLESDQTRSQWPYASRCELTLSIGKTLKIGLATTNLGTASFPLSEALHTYFHIGDINQASVTGLSGEEYLDKVDNFACKEQVGAVTFHGETDRVYVNTQAHYGIDDPVLKRRIKIHASDAHSVVVWTPWQEKADKMGDFGSATAWQQMVCVETANALNNALTVHAGETHTLVAEYSVETL